MSNIEKILARIPSMDARARTRLRKNAQAKLKLNLGNEDARRVIDVLDELEKANFQPQNLVKTGLLSWEKRPLEKKIFSFRAFHEDCVVGWIHKRANHSSTEKDVYSVEILGQTIPGQFHFIADARAAGEAAFTEQNQGSS